MAIELLRLFKAYHNCANIILSILGEKCYARIVSNFCNSRDWKKSLESYVETSIKCWYDSDC